MRVLFLLWFFIVPISSAFSSFEEGLKFIEKPSSEIISNSCARSEEPPWCNDLYEYVCKQKNLNEVQFSGGIVGGAGGGQNPSLIKSPWPINFSRDHLQLSYKSARESLKKIISDLEGVTHLEKISMIKLIDNTQLVDVNELFKDPGKDLSKFGLKAIREGLIRMSYIEMCGANGLGGNAFKPFNVIVVCPGLLGKISDKEMLTTVLVHELGHRINTSFSPGIYKKFHRCIQRVFHSQINSTFPLSSSWVKYKKNEISADYWSARILGAEIESQNLSPAESVQMTLRSVKLFCNESEGINHPSGRFRINVLFRRDPKVSFLLGCKSPSRTEPTCTLEGQVPAGLLDLIP